jgi:membrane protease YdiL (CAAX protease family)
MLIAQEHWDDYMTTIAATPIARHEAASHIGRILLGFATLYAVYFGSALPLAAVEPTVGALARTLVTLATVVVLEMSLFKQPLTGAVGRLGFGWPGTRWLGVAAVAGAPLVLFFPVYAALTGTAWSLPAGWLWTYLGYVAVSGLTEEVMFRAFLFGRLRAGRGFWAAATLAMLAFTAVHLLLFLRLNVFVAVAATLLAAAGAYPLAYLYERAGRSVWPCGLLHSLAHLITVVAWPAGELTAPLAFMAVAAVSPWLVFAFGRNRPPA